MHLAESIEEIEYAKNRTGKTADFIKRIGAWDAKDVAWGCHPIDKVLEIAKDTPFIAAHLNYIEDHHLPMLAASNITVAYCPRASEYFGHTNHRWKEMLHAGVTVALGTDSLLCLDTPDRISIIDEMRCLYTQHRADPVQLLTMATINGAMGLGLDPNLVTLNAGETAGLLAFESTGNDPLFDIFNATTMPTWL
jgi:cytosine/adenosine deaminase-related metal-dependent hydrolase